MTAVFKYYRIQNKICKTVTDNGSNFVKAFREYEEPCKERDCDTDEVEAVDITTILDEGQQDDTTDDINVDIDYLPSHQRCASHTLNLVATADSRKALDDRAYKKIHRSTFGKAQGLWNKQNQSIASAEIIHGNLSRYLVCPNATRWNSTFKSLQCLQTMLVDKRTEVDLVCDQLTLPRFVNSEITFIKEYCQVMGCVANALDILQGELYMYMGFYTPTITKLQAKLEAFSATNLVYVQPLVTAVQEGVNRRFEDVFKDENIIAAMLHPLWKANWAWIKNNPEKKEEMFRKITEEMERSSSDVPAEQEAVPDPEENETVQGHADTLRMFLSSQDKKLSQLNGLPAIKSVFVKYNSAIPSSAPVERLFSAAKEVFTCKRGCLKDVNFEKQLLLKVNLYKNLR